MSAGECSVEEELNRVAGGSNILDFAEVAALLLLPLWTLIVSVGLRKEPILDSWCVDPILHLDTTREGIM